MMNRPISYILPAILLLLSGCSTAATLSAQDARTITIDATGEVLAPADEIIFNIVINRFDSEASAAFDSHKEQERFLTRLIIDQQIDEEYINAYPINISPRRHSQNPGFETRQSVTLRLQNLDQFESMQITLIENGFDNFSANFSTTSVEEYQEKALEAAVEAARDKAGLLARASGAELGEVLSINYTTSQPVARREMAMMSADSYNGSLIEMQRSIPVRENVRVQFQLK